MSVVSLRLDGRNVLRCGMKRVRGVGLDCDTPVARPSGGQLVIRCRNCHTDHTFGVADGKIVPLEPRAGVPVAPGSADALASNNEGVVRRH